MPTMMEFNNPIPCVTEHGDGYVWYVTSSGILENDIFAIILCDGGIVRFYRSDKFIIYKNATFDIKEKHDRKTI